MQNKLPKNFRIDNDNIIRDEHGHPRIDNAVYQELVVMKQNNKEMTMPEDRLYGQSIMSLVEIILNCPKLKFQKDEVKSECRTNAYIAICDYVPKYFKKDSGSKAVSYAYRVGYTAMIHVLEKTNKRNETLKKLEESYNEMLGITVEELEESIHQVTRN